VKVWHLSQSDNLGGAARAALRLHLACVHNQIDSRMVVGQKNSDLYSINANTSKFSRLKALAKQAVTRKIISWQRSNGTHSLGLFPSGLVRKLNSDNVDVLNLHWVGAEFLSVEDIGKFCKPIVWTLHDMWAFCGAEHYAENDEWQNGYSSRGFWDLDKWVWTRKKKAWTQPIYIVTPSDWLADCVKKSALMGSWQVRTIPYPLDTNVFQPRGKFLSREILGLPLDKKLVLFGAISPTADRRKGWDLLQLALQKLAQIADDVVGVIFGQSAPPDPPKLGLPLQWMGYLHDDITLSLLYSAVDVMVVPSRQDNFPQTSTEPQACGTPVVAFNVCGLPSAVEHERTGYLAKPFDTDDLAYGISWVLSDRERWHKLSSQARERAVRLWSPEVVAKQYLEVYEAAIAMRKQVKKG
jgi:glycosyltransferase involved in cell wall biosynthesis